MDFGFSESNNVNMRFGFLNQGALGDAPVNTVPPVISALTTITIGQTLSCTEGTWTGTLPITFTYQWFRDAGAISGATNSTYVLTANEIQRTITCVVTGTNAFGASSATSNGLFTAFMVSTILGANYLYDWNPAESGSLTLTMSAVDSIASVGLNSNPFVQTGAARPQLVSNQINGKPVIRFDGATSWMDVASSTALFNFLHNATGGTVIFIVKSPNVAVSGRLLENKTISTGTGGGVLIVKSSGGVPQQYVTTSGALVAFQSQSIFLGNYESFVCIFDPPNATLNQRVTTYRNNGAAQNTNTQTGAFTTANAPFNLTLGVQASPKANYLDFDLVRLIISNTKMTPTQVSQLQDYLEFEYGTFPIA